MKKVQNKFIVFLLIIIVLSGCTSKGMSSAITSEEVSEMQLTLEEEYLKQNRALTGSKYPYYYKNDLNSEGINLVYGRLFNYVWEEKAELTYADIEEYLSQEYEDDGSVRIYNNGNWPEIEKYVEWLAQKTDNEIITLDSLPISMQIKLENEYEILSKTKYEDLGMHNIKELVFASRDPEYVPNFNEETRATDEAKRAQEGASKG